MKCFKHPTQGHMKPGDYPRRLKVQDRKQPACQSVAGYNVNNVKTSISLQKHREKIKTPHMQKSIETQTLTLEVQGKHDICLATVLEWTIHVFYCTVVFQLNHTNMHTKVQT